MSKPWCLRMSSILRFTKPNDVKHVIFSTEYSLIFTVKSQNVAKLLRFLRQSRINDGGKWFKTWLSSNCGSKPDPEHVKRMNPGTQNLMIGCDAVCSWCWFNPAGFNPPISRRNVYENNPSGQILIRLGTLLGLASHLNPDIRDCFETLVILTWSLRTVRRCNDMISGGLTLIFGFFLQTGSRWGVSRWGCRGCWKASSLSCCGWSPWQRSAAKDAVSLSRVRERRKVWAPEHEAAQPSGTSGRSPTVSPHHGSREGGGADERERRTRPVPGVTAGGRRSDSLTQTPAFPVRSLRSRPAGGAGTRWWCGEGPGSTRLSASAQHRVLN